MLELSPKTYVCNVIILFVHFLILINNPNYKYHASLKTCTEKVNKTFMWKSRTNKINMMITWSWIRVNTFWKQITLKNRLYFTYVSSTKLLVYFISLTYFLVLKFSLNKTRVIYLNIYFIFSWYCLKRFG